MLTARGVYNSLRGLLQRYGTESIKRRLWNNEYKRGWWNCLDSVTQDCAYQHIEKYAATGDILDLGCGPGQVGSQLTEAMYRSYVGVDISDTAIEKARSRTKENGRTSKNNYVQSDILTYRTESRFDVIFFGDSIYYFSLSRIAELLSRYSANLKPDGVFIIRTWAVKEKHRTMLRNIESSFKVLEKHAYSDSKVVVIVFRPNPRS